MGSGVHIQEKNSSGPRLKYTLMATICKEVLTPPQPPPPPPHPPKKGTRVQRGRLGQKPKIHWGIILALKYDFTRG